MFREKRHAFRTLTVCFVALSVWLPTGHAAACLGCEPALVLPDGGDIPGNAVTFRYTSPTCMLLNDGAVPVPHLYRLDGQTRIEVPLRMENAGSTRPLVFGAAWFSPEESLAVGTQLVLETPPSPSEPTGRLRNYQVTALAPLPTELGTLQATVHRDSIPVADSSGGCFQVTFAAYADLTVELSPAARPYAALFDYRLFVDGAQISRFHASSLGPPSLPRGQDRVYTSCAEPPDIEPFHSLLPGLHRVRFNAVLRGVTIDTPEIEVELACPGARADAAVPQVISMVDAGAASAVPLTTDTSASTRADGCQLRPVGAAPPVWVIALSLCSFVRRRRDLRRTM